jgi:cysteine-rich repeat protein
MIAGCDSPTPIAPDSSGPDIITRPDVAMQDSDATPDETHSGHELRPETVAPDTHPAPDSHPAPDAVSDVNLPEGAPDSDAPDSPERPPMCPPIGALLIVELMIDPVRVPDTLGEYVEFLNAGKAPLDLRGWEIRSGSQRHELQSDAPLVVQPGGLFVMAANADPGSNGGFTADYAYERIRLANTQGDVAIWCGDLLIDRVAWQSGSWPLSPGRALVLDPAGHDADRNDSAAFWCQADAPFGLGDNGSPGYPDEPCGDSACGDGVVQHREACDDGNRVSGDGCSRLCRPESFRPGSVIISEFHYSPGSATGASGEYVELHNMTGQVIDIAGWTLSDDRRDSVRILPADGVLDVPPRGYVVLGRSTDTGRNGGIHVDWEYGNRFILSAPEDRIVLSWNETVIDRVDYRIDAVLAFPPAQGRSLNLDSTCFDDELNDEGAFWCPSRPDHALPGGDFGTPGASNHPCP